MLNQYRIKLMQAIADGRIQWVNRPTKDGRPGFYRCTPYTYRSPSRAQAEARLRFSEVSYNLFGTLGTINTIDGKSISKDAVLLGEEMSGQKFRKEKKMTNIERMLLLLD